MQIGFTSPRCRFKIINSDFLYCRRCPLRTLRKVRRTTQKHPSTIRCVVMIIKLVASHPAPTLFTVWWCRRPIRWNAIVRTILQPFSLELEIPSCWGWREAWISPPVRLMWTHWPVPTGCMRSMWPRGHTTKRPRFSYFFVKTQKDQFCLLIPPQSSPLTSIDRLHYLQEHQHSKDVWKTSLCHTSSAKTTLYKNTGIMLDLNFEKVVLQE